MRIINAKFKSTCSETGCVIKKGERMVYDPVNKKCYAIGSNTAVDFINKDSSQQDNASVMIQANEESYFDNFCQNNGI